jgi:hypothetical protein
MKCLLEGCKKEARKKFCSNAHKDKWWNNERGFKGFFKDNFKRRSEENTFDDDLDGEYDPGDDEYWNDKDC